VGDRFELGGFLLERCRRQIWIGRVVVEELWVTAGLNRESCCWRDVGDRFRSGRVNIREMWATGSSWEGFRWRDVDNRFGLGGLLLKNCG
jgi:hypothetical protein